MPLFPVFVIIRFNVTTSAQPELGEAQRYSGQPGTRLYSLLRKKEGIGKFQEVEKLLRGIKGLQRSSKKTTELRGGSGSEQAQESL